MKHWIEVKACPACDSSRHVFAGKLSGSSYAFGRETIDYPDGGIDMRRCEACTLIFKEHIPYPAYLSEVFERQAGNVWNGDYAFAAERARVAAMAGDGAFDLLDVGPSNGNFLAACADIGGRRSGLDIVMHPGLDKHLRGEFIHGLVDSESLEWSGEPYDIVTAFDVFEHFYTPEAAFRNLAMLLKAGGQVLIETGDVTTAWPARYGAGNWWYAQLFEHHIFWSRDSLAKAAEANGFELLSFELKRHKRKVDISGMNLLKDLLKVALYRLSPSLYARLAASSGSARGQPASPVNRDHMLVVLRKR